MVVETEITHLLSHFFCVKDASCVFVVSVCGGGDVEVLRWKQDK
jgi:hypothetical protein